MRVVRSNSLEELLAAFAEVTASPRAALLAPEQVLVPPGGMSRWLQQSMAQRVGVCANMKMRSPSRFLSSAVRRLLAAAAAPSVPERASLFESRAALAWRVAERLPSLLSAPAFEPVAHYLAQNQPDALYQLAERIAERFQAYVLHRPEWARAWDAGEVVAFDEPAAAHEAWQRLLWREVVADEPGHLAARVPAFRDACEAAAQDAGLRAKLPERVLVFAPTDLAPLHLELLSALARALPVHVFSLSASASEPRHALLESLDLRAPAREAALLQRASDVQDKFATPALGTLLGDLRRSLMTEAPVAADASTAAASTSEGDSGLLKDGSLEVHICHTPLREVEVLHDRLVDAFERDRELRPEEVLVRVAGLDVYAPLIESVFGHRAEHEPRIPFSVGGAHASAGDSLTEALLAALTLLNGRFDGPAVMDLLSRDAVCARLGLSSAELETVRGWLIDAGACWATDAADRDRQGAPALRENTFRFALDRLLLGVAMDARDGSLFEGVLPLSDVEGGVTAVLGRVARLLDGLFERRANIDEARGVHDWCTFAEELLDLVALGTQRERASVSRRLRAWSAEAERAGHTMDVPFTTVVRQLPAALRSGSGLRGMFAGGVSFVPLGAAPGIPARVTAILGLDDDFPRRGGDVAFDLLAHEPRETDPSPRDEDRAAFLWSLLAAQDRLLVSYVGRSAKTNVELPPSVVLAELLDELDARFSRTAKPSTRARDAFTCTHPLQPFSPRYFEPDASHADETGPALFSYARRYLPAARALSADELEPRPFFEHAAGEADAGDETAEREEIALEDLIRTLCAPTASYLRRALELTLPQDEPRLSAREPIDSNKLEEWKRMTHAITERLDGRAEKSVRDELRASGQVPLGVPGELWFDEKRGMLFDFVRMTERERGGPLLPPQPVRLALKDADLVGDLSLLAQRPDGTLSHGQVTYSATKGKHVLNLWIRHLVFCAQHGPARSWLVSGSKITPALEYFAPVQDAIGQLEQLVEVYRFACRTCLPLFPHTSFESAQAWFEKPSAKKKKKKVQEPAEEPTEEEQLESAELAFMASRHVIPAEADEWQNRVVWANDNPFRVDFEAIAGEPKTGFLSLARTVYLPAWGHLFSGEES